MKVRSELILLVVIVVAILGAGIAYALAHNVIAALAASAGVLLMSIVFATRMASQ